MQGMQTEGVVHRGSTKGEHACPVYCRDEWGALQGPTIGAHYRDPCIKEAHYRAQQEGPTTGTHFEDRLPKQPPL